MKPRTLAGLAMMFASFAFYGAGGMVISSAIDMQEREARQRAETDRQCLDLLRALPSSSVADVDGVATVVIRDVMDPRRALSDGTLAQAMCPGRKLTEVCLGDGCQGGVAGESVVLRLKLERN